MHRNGGWNVGYQFRAAPIWLVVAMLASGAPATSSLAAESTKAMPAPVHQEFLSTVRSAIRQPDVHTKIWPGFRLETIPLVFHEPGNVAFLFNYRGTLPTGYQWLDGYEGVAVSRDTSGLQAGISLSHPVGDQLAVTVSLALNGSGSTAEALLVALHEGFHYHQQRVPGYPFLSRELEPDSPRDMALAEVEQKWLAKALQATGSAQVKADLCRFVAVREERRKSHDPQVAINENGLEAREGTAQYVERQFAALAGLRPTMPEGMTNSLGGDVTNLVTLLQQDLEPRFCRRTRYYWTGAAMGYCLDALGVEWKPAVDNGVDLLTQIKRASGYAAGDQARLIAEALQGVDLAAAGVRLACQLQQAESRAETALRAFQATAGLRVEILIPDTLPLGVEDAGSLQLSVSDTLNTAEATVAVSTKGLDLEARGISLLEHQAPHHRFRLTLFLPVGPAEVHVDGHPLVEGETRAGRIDLQVANLSLRSPKVSASWLRGGLVLDLGQGR